MDMIGYGIFAGCILLLAGIYLTARKGIDTHNIQSMIFGGKTAGPMGLTFSVFAAWMWTTSVFGSAETYALYGVWGPISYVAGACIAFAGLIGVLVLIRKHYPTVVTWLEFIQIRFGRRTKLWFYLFAVIAPAYVLVEQGVGIAYVLETFYGCSFRSISFFSVILATGFVFFGGMKSVIAEEKIASLIIIAGFLAGAVWVIRSGDIAQFRDMPFTMEGVSLSGRIGTSAITYFIVAIVIAFGQIVFDPAYYIKAQLARSTKEMAIGFTLGGIVIWGGITVLASLYMGHAAMVQSSDVTDLFHGPAKAIFSFIIIIIGMSTIAHFMIGFLGAFSIDLYRTVVKPEGTDKERIVFGRIMIVAVGLSCASITIALENISLLTIDVFCAIFFAAPCVPMLIGFLSQRNFGKLPIIATVAGTIGGIALWMAVPGGVLEAQLAGLAAAILLSFLIMLPGFLHRMPYDK